jgi:hypothetical protein
MAYLSFGRMLNDMSFCLGLNNRLLQNDMSFSNSYKTTRFVLKEESRLAIAGGPRAAARVLRYAAKSPKPARNCREIRRGRLCS